MGIFKNSLNYSVLDIKLPHNYFKVQCTSINSQYLFLEIQPKYLFFTKNMFFSQQIQHHCKIFQPLWFFGPVCLLFFASIPARKFIWTLSFIWNLRVNKQSEIPILKMSCYIFLFRATKNFFTTKPMNFGYIWQ